MVKGSVTYQLPIERCSEQKVILKGQQYSGSRRAVSLYILSWKNVKQPSMSDCISKRHFHYMILSMYEAIIEFLLGWLAGWRSKNGMPALTPAVIEPATIL